MKSPILAKTSAEFRHTLAHAGYKLFPKMVVY